jgi:excinuclease ABC subunit C
LKNALAAQTSSEVLHAPAHRAMMLAMTVDKHDPSPSEALPPPTLPDRFIETSATKAIESSEVPQLELGTAAIKAQLKTLSKQPGVYRMLNAAGDVLYVGKARQLKNRVAHYTQANRLTNRLQRMVAQTRSMVILITQTEAEALLLEASLIKRYRPPYNVLMRDDKSFPYIYLREEHAVAQITKHRGARAGKKGAFYGPFASTTAVNETLNTLQKIFLLRSCADSVYENRSRPCLLYQIERCSAPCTGAISAEDYAGLVRDAKAFLSGRSQEAQEHLAHKMQEAAEALAYETAALYRNRLRALTYIQQQQAVHAGAQGDADIVAIAANGGVSCLQVFFIRNGQNWGSRALYPRHDKQEKLEDVLQAFLAQFYEDKPTPAKILLDRHIPDQELLAQALSLRAGFKVSLEVPQRGQWAALMATASRNAQEALDRKLAEDASTSQQLKALTTLFALHHVPRRIEIYDNSHIQGAHQVGAMVVAGPEGFRKGQYRKFNIKNPTTVGGDDFAMLREVLTRRFKALLKDIKQKDSAGVEAAESAEQDLEEAEDVAQTHTDWPDLILIDGGRGQLNVARAVQQEAGLPALIPMVAIAKGPERNAGREILHLPDGQEISLEAHAAVLFYLQRLRDEAHRYAIGSHRSKRARAMEKNPLDEIEGIGAARKKALLLHFGAARAVREAGIADLRKVPGISEAIATRIYAHFHPSD